MIIEIKVPSPGESISEVQLAQWLVEDGAYVDKDADIAEIDSDKATLNISAEESGEIKFKVEEGDTIKVGDVIATIDTEAAAPEASKKEAEKKEKKAEEKPAGEKEKDKGSAEKKEETQQKKEVPEEVKNEEENILHISPLAKKLMKAEGMSEKELLEIIKKHRISRVDIEYLASIKDNAPAGISTVAESWGGTRETESKKMTTLRRKIAERLVAVKNETAMLTTFNEVNMTPIMEIRKKYKEVFKEKFGVSLGFMSFFTKAVCEALNLFPAVNSQLEGDEAVTHKFADIGIAVSTPKGLMVPVLRNAETMSLAEIELKIKDLAVRARDNKITLEEMKGGTFTITNGGVFGSMLSTPIINPPQSAILGMHNIVERPIAVNGEVEIHPVMYIALSYDHRIIDGKESVSFLVKIKEMLEDPAKMMFRGQDPVSSLLGL